MIGQIEPGLVEPNSLTIFKHPKWGPPAVSLSIWLAGENRTYRNIHCQVVEQFPLLAKLQSHLSTTYRQYWTLTTCRSFFLESHGISRTMLVYWRVLTDKLPTNATNKHLALFQQPRINQFWLISTMRMTHVQHVQRKSVDPFALFRGSMSMLV